MDIIYKETKELPLDQLDNLVEAVGWKRRGSLWQRILDNTGYAVSAWDDNRLIGFARCLEDGVMCVVFDVSVHPDYQGNKIGSELMRRLTVFTDSQDYECVRLFAWDKEYEKLKRLYERYGFKPMSNGMGKNKPYP